MPTPPKPARFHPEDAPPGFEKNLISFWQERSKIVPRLQLVHTNWASREGSIEASKNWAEMGGGNTIPHFQIDRSGRAALLLPLDRKGIANFKAADFSIGIETADRGTIVDPAPNGSPFTPEQAESVSVAFAWGAWGFNIPLRFPDAWDGAGTAGHTIPFGFPFWTNSSSKECPGRVKKGQLGGIILRAQEILAAWTAPFPTPDPTPIPDPPNRKEKILYINRLSPGELEYGDGLWARRLRSADHAAKEIERRARDGHPFIDFKSGREVHGLADVSRAEDRFGVGRPVLEGS